MTHAIVTPRIRAQMRGLPSVRNLITCTQLPVSLAAGGIHILTQTISARTIARFLILLYPIRARTRFKSVRRCVVGSLVSEHIEGRDPPPGAHS